LFNRPNNIRAPGIINVNPKKVPCNVVEFHGRGRILNSDSLLRKFSLAQIQLLEVAQTSYGVTALVLSIIYTSLARILAIVALGHLALLA